MALQKDGDKGVDWSKVFGDESLFKQIYKQEIIMAVMERDEEGMTERVVISDVQDEVLKEKTTEKKEETKEERERAEELRVLKTNWA